MLRMRNILKPLVFPLRKGTNTTAVRLSEDLFVHRDTEDNNASIPFEFTPENHHRLCCIINNYPIGYERCALGAALDIAQRQEGWVSISAMMRIAKFLEIPRMRVYEFVTFYTMYRRRYMGKYLVQVCGTTPCMLRGAEDIMCAVEHATGARAGEVSPDGVFGVQEVECAGACANAPVVCVNDDYYEDVTPEGITYIVQQLRAGDIPPHGPQNGRYSCEPITGLTSLTTWPTGPGYGVQREFAGPDPCGRY